MCIIERWWVNVYRLKATLQSEDGRTWLVQKVEYLLEKRTGWERSKFISHNHCTKWRFILEE
jgi:hypothetical protein